MYELGDPVCISFHMWNLWFSVQDKGTQVVVGNRRWGESPPSAYPHPTPGTILTAWSRSVSSLRRFLHFAAASLFRSRRTLLFSSSSGVS